MNIRRNPVLVSLVSVATCAVATCAVAAIALGAVSARAVPTTLTYAGVLTDSGVRVEGAHNVQFDLFDDDTSGTVQYSEEILGLIIIDGELVAELGNNNLDDSVLDLPELWLEVTVDGTPLAPRVRLNSVPYALRAIAAQQAIEAVLADEALSLGGILPEDVVTTTQLAAQLSSLGLSNGVSAGTGIVIASGQISIANGGVNAAQLGAGAVGTAALANLAVTSAKIANGAVTSTQIANNAVGTAQIASQAVNSSQIADGAVKAAQIANAQVGTIALATGSVTSAILADNAVTSAKIADGAVTSADITDATIVTADIADDAVNAAKINNALAVFQVGSIGCLENPGDLRIGAGVCSAETVGCPATQCKGCNTNVCGPCAQPVCANTFVGFLVGP